MNEVTPDCVYGLREGGLARIVLDRPRALNALTLPMVRRIRDLLEGWRPEPPRVVVIESSTGGVFSAGGDIRQIRQNSLDDATAASDEFFETEYRVDELLATYPVPVVALIDGVCMGGGLGLSIHGAFRVVTERAVLAMPETMIGFFPDVGASYFLSRLPGALGTYLGLTGVRLDDVDAVAVGLATHRVRSKDLAALVTALADDEAGPVEAVLRRFASAPERASALTERRRAIDEVFSATSIEQIIERLDTEGGVWAAETHEALNRRSPQSLALTLDLLLWGSQRSLHDCLRAEREAGHHVTRSPDFIEGVRAALVDKDRAPVWGASRYRGMSAEGEVLWSTTGRVSGGSGRCEPAEIFGSVGVWLTRRMPPDELIDVARTAEGLGFGTVWIAGGGTPGVFEQVAAVLDATERIVVGTSIANMYSESPAAATAATNEFESRHPRRFYLGVGPSHARVVEQNTDETYEKPLVKSREYLAALDEQNDPVPHDRILLSALGPLSLRLAGRRTLGSIPYLGPVAHTRFARDALGEGPALMPELTVVLETGPGAARAVARTFLSRYLDLPNYTSVFIRAGFTDEDLENGGSGRLVDAVVATGDASQLGRRIDEHLAAGADHVALQVLPSAGQRTIDVLRAIAAERGLVPSLDNPAR
ncbi:3-hydroxyisobutyryl-CoA hydrolase [Subtercola sp. YIM 133946]|uniref:3-hydroxyisobutyryl-CoA hydrolase n=1 Tax=Subtercola sp. YIM 133946 TaxID=3118909 RepID=UPI002F9403FB